MNRSLALVVAAALTLLSGGAEARIIPLNGNSYNQTTNPPTNDLWCNGGQIRGGTVMQTTEICQDFGGDWIPTTTNVQNLGTSALGWKEIFVGNNSGGANNMGYLGTQAASGIAALNLGLSQFFAVDASGNFLAICVSTGGVGGSVLASDGTTPCYGATFSAATGSSPVQLLGQTTFYTLLSTGTLSSSLTITNSTVSINVGSAGSSYTNTASTVTGLAVTPISAADSAAFNAAYTAIKNLVCTSTQTSTLAGATLQPGVACYAAAATLTGVLTLSGGPNSLFVLKAGNQGTGALTTTNFTVNLVGGVKAANVYWWAADAGTFTDTIIPGNILTRSAITLTRVTQLGRAMSAGTVTGTNVIASAPQ